MPNLLPSRQHNDRKYPWQTFIILADIPPQDCSSSLTCICTSTIGSELQSCMSCLTEADPSVETDAQSSLDSWNQACGGSLSVSWWFDRSTSNSLTIYSLLVEVPAEAPAQALPEALTEALAQL